MSDIASLSEAPLPLSPLVLQMRRTTGSLVGRVTELTAVRQEIAVAKKGQLAALTFEGEPGIGKSRLLLTASDVAEAEGFVVVAVAADEEIRGPFLLARAIFGCREAQEAGGGVAREDFQRALNAISGLDDPALEGLSPDHKLLRTLDLAAIAVRSLASHLPVALLVDDLQWADEDSVRMLRYIVRADADLPMFLAFAVRRDELALTTEAAPLLADMERLGLVRRISLSRLTQLESTALLKQGLGGEVAATSAATMHAQSEGVPFILEELARAHRDTGLLQQIDGVWSLAKNAERLLPSAVRTLIQRRAARVPDRTRAILAQAAVLGRSFSLDDLCAVKLRLADDDGSDTTTLADALAPAVSAGLLLELGDGAAADYTFTHEQVREFSAASLTPARRRAIHGAIVELIAGDGDPPRESLPLLARHALAAGDADRAARFSVDAARAALASRAPEEVLRVVEEALPAIAAVQDRVALLTARDEALDMLRRPADRLEGLAELAALAEALSDSHLELETLLRRAAALRFTGDEDSAVALARDVRSRAQDRGDRRAELAACLQLGQAELRAPLGEAFAPSANDVDLGAAAEAYECACRLASQLGDQSSLAAATRELGVIETGRIRAWFVDLVKEGRQLPIAQRIAAGESPGDILPELPIAPMVEKAMQYFSQAIELYEQIGDRRGLMSSIIAMAYIPFGTQIHLQGSAQRIEEIRRLTTQMYAMSRESERARADAQMLYGAHVFARAKCVADLALSRGREAYDKARMLGDRSLEFASAGGVALAHLDLGEVGDAEQWVGRAAAAAAAAPTPLRARQLEMWRGICQGTAGDAAGMRQHLERAVQLATEQGRPAPRCEASAHLALLAARLGADSSDDDLLSLAERSARETKQMVPLLPGHPLWGAKGDAALAMIALARGDRTAAADAGRSALVAIEASHVEDLNLDTVLPAARAVLSGGLEEEQQMVRGQLSVVLALIAQRIVDEDVRVRWFRGPLGRELTELAGPLELPTFDGHGHVVPSRALTGTEARLLHMLVEGRTNREMAEALGVTEDAVALQLTEFYAKIGSSSRAEATAFAFRERVV